MPCSAVDIKRYPFQNILIVILFDTSEILSIGIVSSNQPPLVPGLSESLCRDCICLLKYFKTNHGSARPLILLPQIVNNITGLSKEK